MIDLCEKLEALAKRMVATTEFHPDSHTVLEAAIILARYQLLRPEAALTSDSEDALRLSHIRNAFYEWRGGSITRAQFHGVLAEMVAPKSTPQEQR